MGNEPPTKQYNAKLEKQRLEIACIKVKAHLEIQRDRRQGQMNGKEKQLIQMISAPQRSIVDEVHKASAIVTDQNWIEGTQIVIRFCDILKDRSMHICESKGNPAQIEDLMGFIESVMWSTKPLNLNCLKEFTGLMMFFFNQADIMMHVEKSPRVDMELRKCLSSALPTPLEINYYMCGLSLKTGIPLSTINQAGHKFSDQPIPQGVPQGNNQQIYQPPVGNNQFGGQGFGGQGGQGGYGFGGNVENMDQPPKQMYDMNTYNLQPQQQPNFNQQIPMQQPNFPQQFQNFGQVQIPQYPVQGQDPNQYDININIPKQNQQFQQPTGQQQFNYPQQQSPMQQYPQQQFQPNFQQHNQQQPNLQQQLPQQQPQIPINSPNLSAISHDNQQSQDNSQKYQPQPYYPPQQPQQQFQEPPKQQFQEPPKQVPQSPQQQQPQLGNIDSLEERLRRMRNGL